MALKPDIDIDLKSLGTVIGILVGTVALAGSIFSFVAGYIRTNDAVHQLEARHDALLKRFDQAATELRSEINSVAERETAFEKSQIAERGDANSKLGIAVERLDRLESTKELRQSAKELLREIRQVEAEAKK
jgi:hypothetical protein